MRGWFYFFLLRSYCLVQVPGKGAPPAMVNVPPEREKVVSWRAAPIINVNESPSTANVPFQVDMLTRNWKVLPEKVRVSKTGGETEIVLLQVPPRPFVSSGSMGQPVIESPIIATAAIIPKNLSLFFIQTLLVAVLKSPQTYFQVSYETNSQ